MKNKTVKELIGTSFNTSLDLKAFCAAYIGDVVDDTTVNQIDITVLIYMDDEEDVLQKIRYMALGAEEVSLLEEFINKHLEYYTQLFNTVQVKITIADIS